MQDQNTQTLLAQIAKDHLLFETLDTQKSGQDFQEVAVWAVKAALEAAYLAGQNAKPRR